MYLQDNHTSVLGMREYAPSFKCVKLNEAFHIFSKDCSRNTGETKTSTDSLFVYPAQSNFSGTKYPFSWIEKVHKGALNTGANWYVALDAASYVSTNQLDLSRHKPDFISVSFYKMFGYPTGLGALIVKNSSQGLLNKRYFGGGTVFMVQASEDIVVRRELLHDR